MFGEQSIFHILQPTKQTRLSLRSLRRGAPDATEGSEWAAMRASASKVRYYVEQDLGSGATGAGPGPRVGAAARAGRCLPPGSKEWLELRQAVHICPDKGQWQQ